MACFTVTLCLSCFNSMSKDGMLKGMNKNVAYTRNTESGCKLPQLTLFRSKNSFEVVPMHKLG